MRRLIPIAVLGALLVGLAVFALNGTTEEARDTLEGRVTRVGDGDSLDLRSADGREFQIRLAQIDAPELVQPWGRDAKAALEGWVDGRDVAVEVVDVDRYGRQVGEVYVGEVHVNAEMVRAGHAWAYTRYARSTAVIELENEARAAARGLWALPEPDRDAPWVWRESHRRGARAGEASIAAPGCEPARCDEFASCAEAMAYHARCGGRGIDGDGDGKPCERLCREAAGAR